MTGPTPDHHRPGRPPGPITRLIATTRDEQTPQVTIEARIVRDRPQFERDLGIIWG
jgi:hypothetical protein